MKVIKNKKDKILSFLENDKSVMELSWFYDEFIWTINGVNPVVVTRDNDNHKALHGLTRSLIANMVTGVTEGFEKKLEINGVGYRAAKQGNKLVLTLGYSHPVEVLDTATVKTEVPDANTILVKGINKQEVGQFAAEIREYRLPEPYKGKGIKYSDERIRRKEGYVNSGIKHNTQRLVKSYVLKQNKKRSARSTLLCKQH